MAEKNVVFVALDFDSAELLEWVFDHFEIGETKLVLTCLYPFCINDSIPAIEFMDSVQDKYLLPCKMNKFEAVVLMPQANGQTEIIFELITKHGMTKLVTPCGAFREVVNAFATSIHNHPLKMWCVSGRKLICASYPGKMQVKKKWWRNPQNEVNLSLKNTISLLKEDKVFVVLNQNEDAGNRIIDWVSENFESDKTTIIIISLEYEDPDFNFQNHYLPQCRKRKLVPEFLKLHEKHYTGKLRELITIHHMKTLIIDYWKMSDVGEYFAKNMDQLCNIFAIDTDTQSKNLIYLRDRREIELLRKENDFHKEKIKLRLLREENTQLTSQRPQSTNKLEKNLREIEDVNKRIHELKNNTLQEEGKKTPEEKNNTKEELQLLERMKNMLAIEEEKRKKVEGELDALKIAAYDESEQHEKTTMNMSMQLEGITRDLATEKEKSKTLEDELHALKIAAHNESEQHEKTKMNMSMQLEGITRDLATEKEKSKTLEDELNKIKREASDESKQHEDTKNKLLDVSIQFKSIQIMLEIEKEKNTDLEDELAKSGIELGKQKKLLEEESIRHQQSDSNSLRTFNQLHEARNFLETEIKNLKKDLEKKGTELQNKGRLNYGVSYGPGMANFSYAELKEATNDFDHRFIIGEGGFGKVYRGIMHCTTVAIKILNNEGGQGEKEFNQEVKTLQKVRHPNLVTLIGACPEKGGLVYEFLPNGSLQDWLGNIERRKSLSWKRRIKIASDTCSALIFLHHFKPHGIAHGDLKPANILLDLNFECKLSDLGICRELKLTDETATPLHQTERPAGTRGYMDPTYNSSYEITTHNDVYAFGVILLQLVTGQEAIKIKRLVETALENETENEVLDTSTEWPLQVAKEMMQLGMSCIHMVKKNRPDLTSEVWAELESMKQFASGS